MRRNTRRRIRLEECWLYAVSSKLDLARRLSTHCLKLSVVDLEKLARDAGNFRLFRISINGKARDLQEPKTRLQAVHLRVHKLLSRVSVPEYLHSAVCGRSYLTNAQTHEPAAPTVKIDIKRFFPSISRTVIFRFFLDTMRCRRDVAGLLADLLTFDARLPTGSSASPIIAYYAFKPMFDRVEALSKARGAKMTCYVDDMTMSGANANGSLLHQVHRIVATYGLRTHKLRQFKAGSPKVVTGVCNTAQGRRVPNRLHLKIKLDFGRLAQAASPAEREAILRTLLGRLYAAGQIEPVFLERARTLRSQIRSERRTEEQRQRGVPPRRPECSIQQRPLFTVIEGGRQ